MADHGADGFGLDAADPPFRRFAVVLVCGLIGVLVALAALALAPTRYRASAELALPSLAAAAAAEDAATSDEVLRTAAALLPAPAAAADGSPGLARLRLVFARYLNPSSPDPTDLAAVRGRVAAHRHGDRVVIVATDDDGRDAARLADAVAQALLARQPGPAAPAPAGGADRGATPPPGDPAQHAQPAHDAARLDQARAEADARAAAVRRVDEALLVDLRARLAAAKARSAEQRTRLAQLERLLRIGGDLDAVPEVAQSPAIAALRHRTAEAARQERQAAKVLGTRHPVLKALREDRTRAAQLIGDELRRIAAAARQELERADAAERALSGEIEAQRAGLAAAVEALTRLRELEQATAAPPAPEPARPGRPAPAPAPPSAGRLIAAATPAAHPEGLPPAALLGIGFAAGCGIGTAVAASRRRPRR